MKATEFEFRHRSVLNLIHFWISFQLYSFDRVNIVWAFVPWNTPHGALVARVIFGFAALLLGFAAGLRTWAAAYLRTAVVHDTDLHAETLVADGPYRYVRNPLYLGTFCMTFAMGFLASRIGFVFLVTGAAIRIWRLIGREQAELGRQQGEGYLGFCRRVPSFIPSLSPRLAASGQKPAWGQAFRGEAAMWGFFVTMVGFTITLRGNVAWFLGGATILIWFGRNITVRVTKRRKAAGTN